MIAYDDVVDDLFDEVKKELCDLLQDKNSNGELCLDLLMIAKYFERIGAVSYTHVYGGQTFD